MVANTGHLSLCEILLKLMPGFSIPPYILYFKIKILTLIVICLQKKFENFNEIITIANVSTIFNCWAYKLFEGIFNYLSQNYRNVAKTGKR